MLKETYHPNAYLSTIKNVRRGLKARTQVITILERHSAETRTLVEEAEMHYGVTLHHLKLLQHEGIVDRKSGKPTVWTLTGAGQRRLSSSI